MLTANKLEFPWRNIDDSQVEAVGFIPRPFEFQIDQAKILDLLTGHTLYNDSSVAIRELVQNSIDAVRLQCAINKAQSHHEGRISIEWNSSDLTLAITDNGTGMTQEIIERHLLNVGSSRYQDPKFKERNPSFSPISRFGIGVLSAFMVADNVQIATFHGDEPQGRQISLRSVHGKYLIRLLDKNSPEGREIGPHGTKIVLKMRASSKRVDVLETLHRWILFPRCIVTAQIDDTPPQSVGFESPKAALEKFFQTAQLGLEQEVIEIHESTIKGVTLAFATIYNTHFRDRQFLQISEYFYQRGRPLPPVGVCVEGIRVEFASPGFGPRSGLLTIVDCTGTSAPKTNVARSALESEADQNSVALTIFDAYLEQVRKEIRRLQEKEGFTLSYAVEQFPFIAGPLYSSSRNENVAESFRRFPMFMLEDEGGRHAASIADLHSLAGFFWTVESQSMASLVQLLKETTAPVTCKQVAEFAKFKGAELPTEPLITNSYLSTMPKKLLEAEFEICEMRASIADRRIDAKWSPLESENPRWINTFDIERRIATEIRDNLQYSRRYQEDRRGLLRQRSSTQIPLADFSAHGLERYFAVRAMSVTRLLPATPLARYFASLYSEEKLLEILVCLDSLAIGHGYNDTAEFLVEDIENTLKETLARLTSTKVNPVGFLEAVAATEGRLSVFNPWSWERKEESSDRS